MVKWANMYEAEGERGDEKAGKIQRSKNKDIGIQFPSSWQIEGKKWNQCQISFSPTNADQCAATKLKTTPWKKKL